MVKKFFQFFESASAEGFNQPREGFNQPELKNYESYFNHRVAVWNVKP